VSVVVRDIRHNIKLKRVYDTASDDDGRRILATRYWPRGVSKSATDEYLSKLAPSRELIKEYQRGDVRWPEFGVRYRKELSNAAAVLELHRLALMARFQVITLLCFCEDEKECHRTLLRDAIIDAASED
jgi:uncharacterized protein YeaO (DUF488 family)